MLGVSMYKNNFYNFFPNILYIYYIQYIRKEIIEIIFI